MRYADAVLDADPNHAGNILLIYNRASVSAAWDSGDHLEPRASMARLAPRDERSERQPNRHEKRRVPHSSHQSVGQFVAQQQSLRHDDKFRRKWKPDERLLLPRRRRFRRRCRAMFYAVTRYTSFNGHSLSLVDGQPSTYQMGDLNSLLHWNYTDTPDAFELRRNQAVYSSTLNPTYYQGNRNAFIDHPEYVWSVFADQANDTSITTSTHAVNLGRVIVGASLGTQPVTINKSGVDGTYYSVTSSGNATSTVSGRYNAFAMDTTGSKPQRSA